MPYQQWPEVARRCETCGSALCPAVEVGGPCREYRYLTLDEVAQILRLSERQVRRLVKERHLPGIKLPTGVWRVDRAVLEWWMASLMEPADPQEALQGRRLRRHMVQNTCLRCGHRWWQRFRIPPAVCPRCGTMAWNRPPAMPIHRPSAPLWWRRQNPLVPDAPLPAPPAQPAPLASSGVLKRQAQVRRQPVIDRPSE
jgi:excisionase family DNA binding protein